MAATQEQVQEIANRGLQDRLPPEKRAVFDELVKRGTIVLPQPGQETEQVSPIIEGAKRVGAELIGAGETALTVGSAIVAEPIAGAAAIGAGVVDAAQRPTERIGDFQPKGANIGTVVAPGTEDAALEAAADIIPGTREAFTFQPRTETGKRNLAAVGEVLAPVAEGLEKVEQGIGDKVFEETDSPFLAGLATAVPTLAAELAGFGLAKGATKIKRSRTVAKELDEATLSAPELRQASSQTFKEIEDAGITVRPDSFNDLATEIARDATRRGVDPTVTPKSNAALRRIQEAAGSGKPLTLTELDTLRKVAQNAASVTDNAADAALGVRMIDSIDEFLATKSAKDVLSGPADSVAQVGAKYKVAREMWGRAKKSELLDQAVELAKTQPSGFENGIRTQFRQIIRGKKQSKFFSKDEIAELQKVVDGSKDANLAKLFGSVGITTGQGSNALLALGGSVAGGAAGGPVAALVVPFLGTVSKRLASKLTQRNAKFANDVIRAGTNGKKIAQAYVKNVPKKNRSPEELAELLVRNDVDLSTVPNTNFARTASQIAQEARTTAGATAATVGAATQAVGNLPEPFGLEIRGSAQ